MWREVQGRGGDSSGRCRRVLLRLLRGGCLIGGGGRLVGVGRS